MADPTLTAVAMSGGVDSSVAACLLANQSGGDAPLVGFSMQLTDRLAGATESYGRCCSPDDFRDARRVADSLGFPHYVVDMEREFEQHVLQPFADDYQAGRTPSPCVRCNTFIKFGALLGRARAVGAEQVATGHYAILEPDPRTGRTLLRQAVDRDKDQSYFLFDLSDAQRRRAVFPLGRMTKDEVRERAAQAGLSNADKPESMDLCFVARGASYRSLLGDGESGEIVSDDGRVLARHEGIGNFTVGQRKGLGVPSAHPLYVLRIDPRQRQVVVGSGDQLERDRCTLERVRWIPFERPGGPLRATIRIRSSHAGASGTLRELDGGRAEIVFDEAQRAITPGQAAVAYDGDMVLGGGWIESE